MVDLESILKYANKLGHKLTTQRLKKPLEGAKINPQYIKPRRTYRNLTNNLNDQTSSKTFIQNHNFEKIDTGDALPSIGNEADIPEKLTNNSNSITKKSVERYSNI